jgi:hypothetical protein
MGETNQVLWGVLLVAYIGPFSLWAMYRLHAEKPAGKAVAWWTAGLVLLLALHEIGVRPAWVLVFAAAGAIAFGAYRGRVRWRRARDLGLPQVPDK